MSTRIQGIPHVHHPGLRRGTGMVWDWGTRPQPFLFSWIMKPSRGTPAPAFSRCSCGFGGRADEQV